MASANGPQPTAEIPESIRRDYLMGATAVRLSVDPTTVPLHGTDWYGHYLSPYVKVFVNGRGPYTFLFDTGSNVTIISSQVAREAFADVISHVPGHHAVVKLRDLRVGNISMRDYYAVVADGDDVDGNPRFQLIRQELPHVRSQPEDARRRKPPEHAAIVVLDALSVEASLADDPACDRRTPAADTDRLRGRRVCVGSDVE